MQPLVEAKDDQKGDRQRPMKSGESDSHTENTEKRLKSKGDDQERSNAKTIHDNDDR